VRGAHNHKLDVALGDWHAAAGLFSISLFVCGFTHTAAPLRCAGVSRFVHPSPFPPGAATPRHATICCFFTTDVAQKDSSSTTASQIRMHRTNPHCTHA
jgi:hypothetical protein